MTDALVVVGNAARRLLSIEEARAGRPRTVQQEKDYQKANRDIAGALDELQDEVRGNRRAADLVKRAAAAPDPTPYLAQLDQLEQAVFKVGPEGMALSRALDNDRGPERSTMSYRPQIGDILTARALSGIAVDGSNAVSHDYSDQVWDLLRAKSRILAATPGVTTFSTDDIDWSIPVGTATTAALAIGQGTAVTTGDWGGTVLTIRPRRFGRRGIFSNELLADVSDDQRNYFVEDMLSAVANAIDLSIVQGTGNDSFTGLSGTSGTTTVTGGTVTSLAYYAQALGSAAVVNAQPTHWILSAVDYGQLLKLTTSGTATTSATPLLIQDTQSPGGAVSPTLFGLPIITSSAYTAGTAFLVEMPKLLVVRRSTAEVQFDPYSLSSTYQTAIRVTQRVGFGVPNAAGVVKITALATT